MTIANDAKSFDGERSGADVARSGHGFRRWVGGSLKTATEALGQRYLSRLTGIPDIRQSVSALPDRMQRTANQTRLVLELLGDVRNGTYRELSWYSVPVAAAALLYAVSPADVIPDAIPLLGAIDDVMLVALAVRVLQRDLRAYCRFKGYPEEQYFGEAGEAHSHPMRAGATMTSS
jgi:uncharacterized membrane protein YkvA (DUF1232 family)